MFLVEMFLVDTGGCIVLGIRTRPFTPGVVRTQNGKHRALPPRCVEEDEASLA